MKELISYFPYNLNVVINNYNHKIGELVGINLVDQTAEVLSYGDIKKYYLYEIKPVLIPLSEFRNYEDIMDEFSENDLEVFENTFFVLTPSSWTDNVNYTIMNLMFKYHLDIFGLIDKGLAINKNKQ